MPLAEEFTFGPGLGDLSDLWAARVAGLLPEPELTVSEWADRYRILGEMASEPGRWRTDRAPYLREIMDCLSYSHPAEFVDVMKGSQVGGTELGLNWLGYSMHLAPGLMMLVMPGLSEVKRNTSTRIDPLIENTPELRERVVEPRSREAGNSIFRKKFPGGELVMTGANSAVGLRSTPARALMLDEIDGYPSDADGEGDPVDLAVRRTTTFKGRRKIFRLSTPSLKGVSRIEKGFLEGDQRRLYVPCRKCRAFHVITWADIRWPEQRPQDAVWACPSCKAEHHEHDKKTLLEEHQWRATVPGDGRRVSFHLPGLYSPWESWGDQAEYFEQVKKDPARLKVFVNTVLGETWEERGEAPEWERLYERREEYRIGVVPYGGVFLTAGADVQQDRIELEVVAWARDRQSWSVDYRVLPGDTANATSPVWAALTEILGEVFLHESGQTMGLMKLAIDEGYNTQTVRDWARRQGPEQVMVCKGVESGPAIVGTPKAMDINSRGKRIARGIRVWPVGDAMVKGQLYGWLKLARPTDEDLARGEKYPPGYCHFPQYDGEYFKQLTAEQVVPRIVKGYTRMEWVKSYERNEALDCFDEETEVLTALGWKRFSLLSDVDDLGTVNLGTDHIEFQRPTDLISRHYSGDMIQIQGRRIDILVTPNHRMVTYKKEFDRVANKWRFDVPAKITLAKDLTIHHQLKMAAQWQGSAGEKIAVARSMKDTQGAEIEPERLVDMGDMAELVGWYIAEGGMSSPISKTQGNRRYRVEISQNLGAKLDRIQTLLARLPWKWSLVKTHREGPGRKLVCTSKQLFQAMAECGGKQDDRRVPQWLKDSPPEIIHRCLDAMILGDGWVQTRQGQRPHRTYATICEKLAGDVQELFIKSGRAANILTYPPRPYKIKGRVGDNTQTQYHVSECKGTKASLDGGGGGKRIFIGKAIPFSGMVYCATVPNGTLICRRNGKSFIAGNCRKYARAAAYVLGLDRPGRIPWDDLEAQYGRPEPAGGDGGGGGGELGVSTGDREKPGVGGPQRPAPRPTGVRAPQRRTRRSGYMR